jgi:hypothetical protein
LPAGIQPRAVAGPGELVKIVDNGEVIMVNGQLEQRSISRGFGFASETRFCKSLKRCAALDSVCIALLCLLLFAPLPGLGQGWTLRGRIIADSTSRGVAGASVSSPVSKAATLTDSAGYFVLPLLAGEQLVRISSVGYFTKTLTITYRETLSELEVRLFPEIRQLQELVVSDKAPDANVRTSGMGVATLDIKNIKNIPVVFGETDIIKALTLQPGVTTVGEGTAGFNVRGGRTDQNLVLLDGAPLFNTSHLLGFLSSVNADAVRDVTLYKGDVPATYGGRLSSLLAMTTRDGNKEQLRFSTGLGLMTGNFTVDGPLTHDKRLTFAAGGRVAYPNFLIRLFPEPTNQNRAFFYDVNLRLSHELSANSILSATFYRSDDSFKFPEDTLYGWRSTTATLRWNKRLNQRLSLEVGGHLSHYAFVLEGISPTNAYNFTSGIRQHDAQTRLLWTPGHAHTLESGLRVTQYQLSPGKLAPVGESNIIRIQVAPEQAREAALYFSDEWVPLSWLSVRAGIRYVTFRNVGPGQVLQYEPEVPRSAESILDTVFYAKGTPLARFGGFEPRLSVRLSTGKASSLKMSYTRARQYLHLISNTTAISPVDYWKLADSFVPPQVATQLVIGYFKNLNDNMVEVSLEVYQKTMANLVEYRNGATLLLNRHLETDLLSAQGKAYGVEASIQKTEGTLTGLVSYTYSRTISRVQATFPRDQINGGDWYPATVDRPHSATASVQWKWRKGWTFGTNFVYTTGRPITYPDGTYRLNDVVVQDFSSRNLDRLPDYHRMDIAFTKDTRRKPNQRKYTLWSFSFYNLYARKNPYSIYFQQTGSRLVSYRLSVFGTIIPSINWKHYF